MSKLVHSENKHLLQIKQLIHYLYNIRSCASVSSKRLCKGTRSWRDLFALTLFGRASVAQWLTRSAVNRKVESSSLSRGVLFCSASPINIPESLYYTTHIQISLFNKYLVVIVMKSPAYESKRHAC